MSDFATNPERESVPTALPTVREEIVAKLIADMAETPGFDEKVYERIFRENPVVGEIIMEALKDVDDEATQKKLLMTAGLVYESLRSQAEANKLNSIG